MGDVDLKPCPFCGERLEVKPSLAGSALYSATHSSGDCIFSSESWWLVPRFIGPWNRRAVAEEGEAK